MRRRIQFSLLGLLLLTAVIAIGVKWWHGPHHVVERPSPNLEDEFTYYREWDGTKIVDGPRVLRYWLDDRLAKITVDFYRHGVRLGYYLTILPEDFRNEVPEVTIEPIDFESTLTDIEKANLNKAVARESESIRKSGKRARWIRE